MAVPDLKDSKSNFGNTFHISLSFTFPKTTLANTSQITKPRSEWDISSTVRKKTKITTFSTCIQPSNGSPSHRNETRKEMKVIQIGNEKGRLILCADSIIFHVENT